MSSSTRRVVVTGIGTASPFGVGRAALAAGLSESRSAVQPLEGRLGRVAPGVGGLVDVPRKLFRDWINTRILRLSTMTRQTTLGCIAAGDLMSDAGLPLDLDARTVEEMEKHPRRGAFLGSFIVPPDFAKQVKAASILARRPVGSADGWMLDDGRLAEAMKMASGFDFLRALPNMPSSHLSIQTAAQGPAATLLGSDATGNQAIVNAVGAILSGQADTMLAGGAFSPFQEVHLAWQGHRGLWSTEADRVCRPYAAGRSGTVPGEGAALLLLEDADHAAARGATILGEVLGAAQRVVTPGDPEEVDVRADALRAALPDGAPDWIGPTGLGHPELDRLENDAYVAAFGDALDRAAAVVTAPQVGFSGPAHGPQSIAAALVAATGLSRPVRGPVDSSDCKALAAALGRSARTGDGAVVLSSCFSLDGVHTAVAIRLGDPAS